MISTQLAQGKRHPLKKGDLVIYTGSRFECYWGVDLTLYQTSDNGRTWACTFDEPDRPGGFGITTWIDAVDLLREGVPQ
jgi:photosystem II stability/assembly factor-like uncharacterized protein